MGSREKAHPSLPPNPHGLLKAAVPSWDEVTSPFPNHYDGLWRSGDTLSPLVRSAVSMFSNAQENPRPRDTDVVGLETSTPGETFPDPLVVLGCYNVGSCDDYPTARRGRSEPL